MVVTKPMMSRLLLAAAFGVAMGLFKGNNTGLRAGLGNLSAPWIVVAFLAALPEGRVARGGH
jgi:hypothetical protein